VKSSRATKPQQRSKTVKTLNYATLMSTIAFFIALGSAGYMVTLTGEDVQAEQGPAAAKALAGARGRARLDVDLIDFRAYEFGTAGITEEPLMEFFVGPFGQPGNMGVRSRHSNGNPKAGAQLYARDAHDRYSLALDYRDAAKPVLVSESGRPFLVRSGAGAPLVLDPSGFVKPRNDGTTPTRKAPPGRVQVTGYVALKNLDAFPRAAPNGSLAMVENRLYFHASGQWVALVLDRTQPTSLR
jgi:hypothetical protein